MCYRLFIEKLIPSMEKANTSRVSVQLRDARESGLIPWEWIVDESRPAESVATWKNPQDIFDESIRVYRRDAWQDQPGWIEVWSEKGTVAGTLRPILDQYGVTFRVMKGWGSSTVVHDVAQMADQSDKNLTVLYVGDRDPSGMHMSEIDLPNRLARYGDGSIDIFRIAVTEPDTADLPSFPAADKSTDTRHKWYVKNFGSLCWELDALSPPVLRDRVEQEIVDRLDMEAWSHAAKIEAAQKASMERYAAGWVRSISGQDHKCDEAGS